MSRISKLFRSSTARSLPARKARLGIESLEGRDVPSAVLSNEVLTVTGTLGNDTIEGGSGDDTIHGGLGNDHIVGGH